jgi:hypothetical protein
MIEHTSDFHSLMRLIFRKRLLESYVLILRCIHLTRCLRILSVSGIHQIHISFPDTDSVLNFICTQSTFETFQ